MKAFCRSMMIAFILGVLAACGSGGEQPTAAAPTQAPATEQPQSNAAGQATATPAAAEPTKPEPTAAPTKPKPTATPEAEAEALTIEESGFIQDKQEIVFAFKVQNPNKDFAVESTKYQIAVYGKDGTVLETDSGYIEAIFPGQLLGIVGSIYLDSETAEAETVEIQLNDGDFEAIDEELPTFTVDRPAYVADDISPKAAAVIKNPYPRDINDVRVNTIAYDKDGKLVGGGYTYLNFIPAEGESAVMVSMTTVGEVDAIELHPAFSSLSQFANPAEQGAETITLVAQGYGQDGFQLGYGLIVKNESAAKAIERGQYNVAAYAEDGTILGTDEGYIDLLLPGQQLGIGDDIYLIDETAVSKLVIQILSGEPVKPELEAPFTSENATFQPGDFSSKVTGTLKSPYDKDAQNIRVSAITFDDAGNITGGGYTYVDFVPANGQAAAEVSVVVAGTPAKAEIYAAVSTMSDFED